MPAKILFIFEQLPDKKDPMFLEWSRMCQRAGLEYDMMTLDDRKYLELASATKYNIYVPCGDRCLTELTGLHSITKWRGSILATTWGAKCVPTYDIKHITKVYKDRVVLARDLQKIKQESWHPLICLPKRDRIIRPNIEQIEEYFAKIREVGHCAVDIETMRHSKISCIGFAADKGSSITIPFVDADGEYWSTVKREQVESLISLILVDPNIEKYGQNFHYDWCYLAKASYTIQNFAHDTLVAHHVLFPELPKDLAFMASLYTNEKYWKDDGKDWRNVRDFEKYWLYNGTDACVTAELVPIFQSMLRSQNMEDTFRFEMSLVPEFVQATLKGIRFDTEWRDELKKSRKKHIKELEKSFSDNLPESWQCVKCKGVGEVGKSTIKECPKCSGSGVCKSARRTVKKGVHEVVEKTCSRCKGSGKVGRSTIKTCPTCEGKKQHINLASNKQLKDLLYKHMKFPVLLKRNTGKISTDIETLVKLQAKTHSPVFATLLDYARTAQELKFLKTKIDSDGRIRTTLACNTETGRLSSSGNPFGTGCLLPDAEVLTPYGWKRIDHITNEEIAQWNNETHEITFVKPTKMHCFSWNGEIKEVKSEQTNFVVTESHRVPFWNSTFGSFKVEPALVVSQRSQVNIPLSGHYKKGKLSIEGAKIRLLVAALADGSLEHQSYRLGFKKERKIERLQNLAFAAGIELREQSAKKGYRRFAFDAKDFMWAKDKFSSWVLELDQYTAFELLDELQYWDGWMVGDSTKFCSIDRQQCEWIATLAHLHGMSATVRTYENKRGYGIKNGKPLTQVNIKPRNYAQIKKKHWSTNWYEGKVYCPTVPNTFFLARCDGFIFVTGNTNLQNIKRSPEYRKLFLADEGYVMYGGDYSQAEARIVAYESMDLEYIGIFERGEDIHRVNAQTIFEKEDISDLERQLGKRVCHGLNYRMGVRTLCDYVLKELGEDYAITEKEARRFKEAYFGRFKGIAKWHEKILDELKANRTLVNCFGRKRVFYGRIDKKTHAVAVAFKPQSTVADLTNRMIRKVQVENPMVSFLHQDHDELLFQAPHWPPDGDKIIGERIKKSMTIPLIINGMECVIPVEMKFGPSWGELK